jgi:hypothetical protein
MQNMASVREILIPANEEAPNAAITMHQIDPDRIITIILRQRHALAIGEYEAKYRIISRKRRAAKRDLSAKEAWLFVRQASPAVRILLGSCAGRTRPSSSPSRCWRASSGNSRNV